MFATSPTPWFRTPGPRPAARLRLLCFHPAGAGPALYRAWPAGLPADIEVLAIHLPGREARIAEPCLTDYADTVTRLHTALRPYLTGQYALFGHSMGAMLAYGVAMAAARHGDRAPEHLFLSGSPGPGSEPRKPGRGQWSDQELVADLRVMGGTPEAVLADPDLLALILPTLRADYAICDSFRQPAGPQLDCPVTILGGESDDITPTDLGRWADVTRRPAPVRFFPGGHFFLTEDSADAVLGTVADTLAPRPA